jgi:sarcosine oxidase subunit beta
MRKIEADVAIIGGGIVGLSIAREMRKRNRKVVVLERGGMGEEASGLNGGGVRQQGRLLPEIPLALAAVEMWKTLDTELGRPTGYRRNGHLYLGESDADMDKLAKMREAEMKLGLESEIVEGKALKELAPALVDGLPGAKYCATDGSAIPLQASKAIGAAAVEAGAIVLENEEVVAVPLSNHKVCGIMSRNTFVEAPVVVNAAGPWAPFVGEKVGVYIPIYPSRSIMMMSAPFPIKVADPFVQTASMAMAVCQLPDGSVRMGAGAAANDIGRFTYSKEVRNPPFEQAKPRGKALEMFPVLKDVKIVRRWAGIRECTPDMMPIIGWASEKVESPEGFFIAAGFSGHGFCLGPVAGRLITEWLVDGKPSIDLSAFSHDRFLRPQGPLTVVEVRPEQTG